MRFLIICILAFLPTVSLAQGARSDENFSSTLNEVFFLCDSVKDKAFLIDTVIVVFKSDTIIAVIEYHNGIKTKAVGYYLSGQLYRESNFKNCDLDGVQTIWYKNGQKEFQAYYEKGQLVIPRLSWYEDGTLKYYSDFNEHLNKGVLIEWYQSGNVKKKTEAIDSTYKGGIEKYYHENGQLYSVYRYNLGKQLFVTYFPNGQKATEGTIINGIWFQVGKWTYWYETGRKKYEFSYSDQGLKEGTWLYWNERGNLIKQEIYEDGNLVKVKEFKRRNKYCPF